MVVASYGKHSHLKERSRNRNGTKLVRKTFDFLALMQLKSCLKSKVYLTMAEFNQYHSGPNFMAQLTVSKKLVLMVAGNSALTIKVYSMG